MTWVCPTPAVTTKMVASASWGATTAREGGVPLVTPALSVYDRAMDITLSPEMETLIRHYMAQGSYPSPESVLMHALAALQELEAMHTPPTSSPPDDGPPELTTRPCTASPLLQWLQATAGPSVGLETLHRRLATLTGSMAETVRAERDER